MRHPNALGPDRPNTVLDRTFVQGRATIVKIVVRPLAFKGFGDEMRAIHLKKTSYYPVKRSDPRGGLRSRRRSRCRGRRARGRNPGSGPRGRGCWWGRFGRARFAFGPPQWWRAGWRGQDQRAGAGAAESVDGAIEGATGSGPKRGAPIQPKLPEVAAGLGCLGNERGESRRERGGAGRPVASGCLRRGCDPEEMAEAGHG